MSGLLIRPAVAGDAEALADIYNHYVRSGAVTFDLEPVSVAARREWIGHHAATGPHRLLVAEEDGRVAGHVSSSRFRDKAAYGTSVETSVYLHPDKVGRGIGTRLYQALFAALAGEDLHRAYAGITLPNPASVALHVKLGFAPLGLYREVGRKFDRYWTVQWFERPLP
ncbi:MAG TPA: GNAT family N-acetyltransferase [Candidatus Polarisedimenticolaceae bacterium]|nr:GNAT family N-acetyltransferase [Candidatus Polarisedimenticolaceae bacterium]